ncbi:MAG: hypothetical protein E6Q97_29695 [Desulfurellales bacterium]|nr:MAG: hypothetical protein E6Q97_29695 [Desulfurellales bacterium]
MESEQKIIADLRERLHQAEAGEAHWFRRCYDLEKALEVPLLRLDALALSSEVVSFEFYPEVTA